MNKEEISIKDIETIDSPIGKSEDDKEKLNRNDEHQKIFDTHEEDSFSYESADFLSSFQLDVNFDDNFPKTDNESDSSTTTGIENNVCSNNQTLIILKRILYSITFSTIIYLILLGLSNSIISYSLDFCISKIMESREKISTIFSSNFWINYLLWICFCFFFSILAYFIPTIISTSSIGSGIPEMKSILSGIRIKNLLDYRTLIAKFWGLVCSFGSGFQIGKEGPFVHISSCIADLLLKINIFKKISTNEYYKNQLFSVAAAAGISATFGCPFGGVLFSIEVCSTYFPVECLWKGVFCSLVGSSIFYFFRTVGYKDVEISLFETNFHDRIDLDEYLPMLVLAVICGFLAVLFIQLVKLSFRLRKKYFDNSNYKLFFITISVALLIGILSFPLDPFLKRSNYKVVNILFTENKLIDEYKVETKDSPNYIIGENEKILILILLVSLISKYLLTIFSISLPISCGMFTSVFIIGGCIGRLFGEITKLFMEYYFNDYAIVPGGYAVVGAAAFSSGVTRTLSTAVVIFELTGQLQYLVPVLISIIISIYIGNLFNSSIYDTILKIKKLPVFSILNENNVEDSKFWVKKKKVDKKFLNAFNIMKTNLDIINDNTNYFILKTLLVKTNHFEFPYVSKDGTFMGTIQRESIANYIEFLKNRLTTEKKKLQKEKSVKIYAKTKKRKNNINHNYIIYDPSFISISKQTSLRKIYYIFSHLGLSFLYITDHGKLVGVITKKKLIKLQQM